MSNLIFVGSKITEDGDWSHKIKRYLLLGRKAMTNLEFVLKIRHIIFPTKVHLVKGVVFPVVMCGWAPVPWRREWQPTPVYFPGESHGQRGLMNYSLWGHKESDTTEVTWHTGMDVRAGPQTRFNVKKKKMFLGCGAGEDSWDYLGQQGYQTSQS